MATALSALRIDGFRTSGVRTNGRPGLSQMDLFAPIDGGKMRDFSDAPGSNHSHPYTGHGDLLCGV